MIITVEAYKKNDTTTLSTVKINDQFFCYALEDADRGLHSDMSLEEILKIKQYGATAIPSGTYEVIMNWSIRFNKYMPLLLNVPGYDGIRMHSGVNHLHTKGCLLLGNSIEVIDYDTPYKVLDSRRALISMIAAIKAVEKHEKIHITITR